MDHRVRLDLHTLSSRTPILGNPLESEQAAFRWVVAVLLGTGFVITVALVVSRPVAVVTALVLAGLVTVLAIRGIIGMLRPPNEVDDEEAIDIDPKL